MANISYDYYRIFYYVGRYGSFTTAAKMLDSNQPNVTKVMNRLEQQTGCTLFVRSNKGVKLTVEGKHLYEHVKVAYEQLKLAEDEMEGASGLERGIVNIGASENALHGMLMPVLRGFHNEHPNVRIHLSNYSIPQAFEALQQSSVDFCVITKPVNVQGKFKITELMEYKEIPVASDDFIHSVKKDSFTLEELAKVPLVALAEGTGTFDYYTSVFAQYGCRYAPDIQVATSDQLLPLIENGLGMGFVPEFMAKRVMHEKKLRILDLDREMPAREICLVEDKNQNPGIAAKTLKKCILKRK